MQLIWWMKSDYLTFKIYHSNHEFSCSSISTIWHYTSSVWLIQEILASCNYLCYIEWYFHLLILKIFISDGHIDDNFWEKNLKWERNLFPSPEACHSGLSTENWRSVVRVPAMTQIFLWKIIIKLLCHNVLLTIKSILLYSLTHAPDT